MNNDIGLNNRTEILTFALLLEQFSSILIKGLLGIGVSKETISFGNKSGCLSFNQKINLLIDIGALPPEDKKKYQTFMEIRNQFMHNLSADTYEACYGFIDGKDKFVLRLYPQSDSLTTEVALKQATRELAGEVLNKTIGLFEKVKEKVEKDSRTKLLEHIMPLAFEKLGISE